jgi:hypothetical protein
MIGSKTGVRLCSYSPIPEGTKPKSGGESMWARQQAKKELREKNKKVP